MAKLKFGEGRSTGWVSMYDAFGCTHRTPVKDTATARKARESKPLKREAR